MDNHLTEIELFEYANDLIENNTQLTTLQEHVESCQDCMAKLELEHSFTRDLKGSLEVKHQVDLSDKIAHYFAQDKPNIIGLDSKGIIYIILGLSALMMLTQVVEINIESIRVSYLNMIFSSVVGLLFVELVFKYFKYKKNNSTA